MRIISLINPFNISGRNEPEEVTFHLNPDFEIVSDDFKGDKIRITAKKGSDRFSFGGSFGAASGFTAERFVYEFVCGDSEEIDDIAKKINAARMQAVRALMPAQQPLLKRLQFWR